MKVKEIFIVTQTHGWNVKANRPAMPNDPPKHVCKCEYCKDEPHYGSVYCKRHHKKNAHFYADHSSRWPH